MIAGVKKAFYSQVQCVSGVVGKENAFGGFCVQKRGEFATTIINFFSTGKRERMRAASRVATIACKAFDDRLGDFCGLGEGRGGIVKIDHGVSPFCRYCETVMPLLLKMLRT